jgi:branched-chain amino acid transport system permease protein
VSGTVLRRAATFGLLIGIINVYLALVGLVEALGGRNFIVGVPLLGSAAGEVITLGAALPLVVAFGAGLIVGRTSDGGTPPSTAEAALSGVIAGLLGGAIYAAFTLLILNVDVDVMFGHANPRLADSLFYGAEPPVGVAIVIGQAVVAALLGALLARAPVAYRRPLLLGLLGVLILSLAERFLGSVLLQLDAEVPDFLPIADVARFLYQSGGLTFPAAILTFVVVIGAVVLWRTRGEGIRRRRDAMPDAQQRTLKFVGYGLLVGILAVLPVLLGVFLSEVAGVVMLFILLGLGLNIVVGFAGLLDLGYVAFYAVGAYVTALLISPLSALGTELSFWAALPIAVLVAALIGLMIGAPVLRLRGDYLAIVTLGFGEIARIIFVSVWLTPWFGGAQGILQVPPPEPFSRDPQSIYYPILVFVILGAIAAWSLAHSRVGRAWNAMREDESVAEATGINTTNYKLLAFALGATFGGVAGAFFAVKFGTVFPQSFGLEVSINALALIILGGMGNIWGVIVGAIVLVGLPNLLREFEEYRALIYGGTLVLMMLLRPEGLIPNRARRAELHDREDTEEEQFDDEVGVETGRPVITTGSGD